MYDLLIDFLNEETSIFKATKDQDQMIFKIEKLNNFILSEQKGIANKNTQHKHYKESNDNNTKKNNYCITKNCYKKCSKAVS